jgi:hypothetical protein
MPERFDAGVFDPELAKLLKGVFESAWARVHVAQQHSEVASDHLAEALIGLVNAGERNRGRLIAKSLTALASAKDIAGHWMIRRD